MPSLHTSIIECDRVVLYWKYATNYAIMPVKNIKIRVIYATIDEIRAILCTVHVLML